MKVVCIIPARGGSKGVPKKNIKKINGKPLLGYVIEVAKKSKIFDNPSNITKRISIAC